MRYNKPITSINGEVVFLQTDCIIVGGGAAGLTAAAALGERGLRVAVIERLDRVGKKLLSTGNGRCNLSNTDMRPALYGPAEAFVADVFAVTPPKDVLGFLDRLGLMTATEDGRIYPRSMQAAAVLDVLRMACDRPNVSLMTGQRAVGIAPSRRGGWSVQLESGEGLFAPALLCAMGGSAAPSMGTDGSGVQLMTGLGHSATPCVPALVQLRSDHPALRALKGIRVQATLTLLVDCASAAQETGELLFCDYGLSGVCVFQLSRIAARALAQNRRVLVSVNLLPEVASLHAWLRARIDARPTLPAASLLTGVFHRLLAQALLREAHVAPDRPVASLSSHETDALCRAIGALTFPITSTQGFAQAQVTSGGIRLCEIDPRTMGSRFFDGLYLAGEVLDVDGPCGGYNLHFAFASALTAARAIGALLGA